jgi:hypothetical protein
MQLPVANQTQSADSFSPPSPAHAQERLKISFFNDIILCVAVHEASIYVYTEPYGLRWLGKICRMTDDRLPLRTLIGRIGGRAPRGRPPKTWIEYGREDLVHLSEVHGVFRTYMNWWLQCKDRKSWTIAIHKLKQTTDV